MSACGSADSKSGDTVSNQTTTTSTSNSNIVEESTNTSSAIDLYNNSEEWSLGKMDITALINASAGDQEKAISDANMVINLSLNKYFVIDPNKDKIELTSEGDSKDFYSIMFSIMSVPDKETMSILSSNFEELISREPINPEIDLYTLTALYSSDAGVEDTTPVFISYQLNDNKKLEKID
jgi:hypothetical protein